ncbi:hypothetical protein [Micromonospora sp. CPCC 206061]|uniref:hypothetical protein n=1 Tax=Micromonospora sp. CPCC 206061 TaxID=3122410 RepID=UPI002FEFC543
MLVLAVTATAGLLARRGATDSPTDSATGPSASPSTTTPQGVLTTFEAPINGAMVGTQKPYAHTISLWTLPSTNSNCELSPCIPGSTPAATVTLPATVQVTCVTTGQKIRNGEPGVNDDYFYEDDRWLRTAPHPDIDGTGYLSNIWFARDKLPTNLPDCPRP